MAKDYKGLTEECWSSVTDTKTFYVTARLVPESENFFNKPFNKRNSKIGLHIQDRTQGKGDQAFLVIYNFDLKDWYYFREMAKHIITTGGAFSRNYSKILDNIQKSGPYKDLSSAFHCNIFRKNKDGNGNVMRSPWQIKIDNGFAKRLPGRHKGSGYEESGSFRADHQTTFNLTDEAVLDLIADVDLILQAAANIFLSEKMEKGRQAFAASKSNGSFSAPVPDSYDDIQEESDQPAQAVEYDVFPRPGIYQDQFGVYMLMYFAVNGNDYQVYFPNGIPEKVDSACKSGAYTKISTAITSDQRMVCIG